MPIQPFGGQQIVISVHSAKSRTCCGYALANAGVALIPFCKQACGFQFPFSIHRAFNLSRSHPSEQRPRYAGVLRTFLHSRLLRHDDRSAPKPFALQHKIKTMR